MKKIILSLLVLLFTFSAVFSPIAYAQTTPPADQVGKGQWWFPRYNEFLSKVNNAPPNEIFGERYTHAQVAWIIHSILNILVGPIAACSESPDFGACMREALSENRDPGAIMPLAALTDTLITTKPASSIDYVAQKMDRLGIVGTAYAQEGFGFTNSLIIAQKLWTTTRDTTYSLVIFAILILGFMIMFRAQLSARTVVTVQSALPRVIIGLLLITFSYAIAGLLVDLTFLAMGIVSGIVASSGLVNGTPSAPADALAVFNQMNNIAGTTVALVFVILISFFGLVLAGAAAGGGALTFASIFSSGGAWAFFSGMSLILIIIIAVLIVVALARVFWVMLRTYVVIIMLVILSPFIFLYGIVKDGINAMWFKLMIANLSVFFSVAVMNLIAAIIIYSTAQESGIGGVTSMLQTNIFGITPNVFKLKVGQVGSNSAVMPGFSSLGATDVIGALIGMGLFFSIPKFASSVRDWIQNGRGDFSPSPAGAALGGGLATYGMDRASRPLKEYMDTQQASAKRAGSSVYGMPNATSYRRAETAMALVDFLKGRLRGK